MQVAKNPVRDPSGTRQWSRNLRAGIGFAQATWNELILDTNAQSPQMHYVIRSEGRILPGLNTEPWDNVYVGSDGIWEASGIFGPGGTDTWYVQSDSLVDLKVFTRQNLVPTDEEVGPENYVLLWNGQEVDPSEIVGDGGAVPGQGDLLNRRNLAIVGLALAAFGTFF